MIDPFAFGVKIVLAIVLILIGLWLLIVGAGSGPTVLGLPVTLIGVVYIFL